MNLRKLMLLGTALLVLASCEEETEYYMSLSTKQLDVVAEGGTYTFDITSNTYYRVNNDCDFARITDTQTSGDVTTFTIAVDENTETKSRSNYIRFIGDNVTPIRINVNQAAVVPVGVDPATLTAGFAETSASFKVLGDKSWTAQSDNADFKVSPSSGLGETVVTISFPENDSVKEKVANITVQIGTKGYTVTLTQEGAPSKEKTDLSASGTSNCYLVTKPGYYKFKATVRGNGVVPESQTSIAKDITPSSVKVLWTTRNTTAAPASTDAVIKNVALEDGYVTFETEMTAIVPGNTVIAALDASNNILWSWHVWCTVPGADITVSGTDWMDRNLGALAPSTYKTVDALAPGLFYQWGRKDPFQGPDSMNSDKAELMAVAGTAFPDPALVSETQQGVAYTIANPQQFLFVSNSSFNNKDWIWGEQFNDLWGGAVEPSTSAPTNPKTKKTMFDPCPVGYCVPASIQIKTAASENGITKTSIVNIDDSGIYGIGNEAFWFVYPGGRLYDSGSLGGPVGQYSWYATSSTYGVNMLCARSHSTACNFGGATSARTCGYAVRCVKE